MLCYDACALAKVVFDDFGFMGAKMQLTAVFLKVPEGYVAFVEELPGANTQGATIEEARENLQEAVQMVLEANRELSQSSIHEGASVSRETLTMPWA